MVGGEETASAQQMIKTYGCSFTKYDWPCWPQFLIKAGPLENHGVTGASNEFIASRIKETAKRHDKIIVMWSGFDRAHDQAYYDQHGHSFEGRYSGSDYSTRELWDKTIYEIYSTHDHCKQNDIEIYNLSAFMFNMGETKELNEFAEQVDIGWRDWPISMIEYCIDNPVLGKETKDTHPSPSQAYRYCRDVVGPYVGIEIKVIDDANLIQLDNNRSN